MLRALTYSLVFGFIRLCFVAVEASIYYGLLLFTFWFIDLKVLTYVPSLYGYLLYPMAVIIALGLGAVIIKLLSIVYYYIKLAQIIAVTLGTLSYLPYDKGAISTSFSESYSNFTSLTVTGTAITGVAKVFKSLKETIMELDYIKKLTESDKVIVKILNIYINKTLHNLLDIIDEIIISYTWYTLNLYERSKGDKKITKKDRAKKQALFMLEGIAFMLRIFPKMLLNTVTIELGIFILSRVISVGVALSPLYIKGFSFFYIGVSFICYIISVKILNIVLVNTLRIVFYIYFFYYELAKLDEFDVLGKISSIASLIPGLDTLIKKSGVELPEASSGSNLFEFNYKEEFKETIKEVVALFGVDISDFTSATEDGEESEFALRNRESDNTKVEDSNTKENNENSNELESEVIVEQTLDSDIDTQVDGSANKSNEHEDLFGESPVSRRGRG